MFFKPSARKLTHRHYYILSACQSIRNKSEIQKAIMYRMDENIDMGRHILPYVQQLSDWGYITRVNPGAPDVKGHKYQITDLGVQELRQYHQRLDSIGNPNPEYRF